MSVRHILALLLIVALALMVVGTAVAPESLVYTTLGVCLITPLILRSRRFKVVSGWRYVPYALVVTLVTLAISAGSMTFLIAFTAIAFFGFAMSPPLTRYVTFVAHIHRRTQDIWTSHWPAVAKKLTASIASPPTRTQRLFAG